jgi:hypothetical protein
MPHLDVIAFCLFSVLGFVLLSFQDNVTTLYAFLQTVTEMMI